MKRTFLFLIAFLFLFGCPREEGPAIIEEPKVEPEKPHENITLIVEPCMDMRDVLERDNCFKELAISSKNRSICEKIYSVDLKDECLFAFFEDDFDICGALMSAEKKDKCLYFHGKREKSIEICNSIRNPDLRNECISAVLPPCALIEDERERELCEAFTFNDYRFCKSDACLFEFGKNRSSPEACEGISDSARKHACSALALSDYRKCEGVAWAARDLCYQLYAENKNDPSVCGMASEGSIYRNNCYARIAILNMDVRYCKYAHLEPAQWDCYKNYSLWTGDYSACALISELAPFTRNKCYRENAIKRSNPSICNYISEIGYREKCYEAVVYGGTLKPDDCEQVFVLAWRDNCLYRVAVQMNDKNICEMISSESVKSNCRSKFHIPP